MSDTPSEQVIEAMADCLLKTHNQVTREEIIAAWRIATRSEREQHSGWKLVPVELTRDMRNSIKASIHVHEIARTFDSAEQQITNLWSDVLNIAPTSDAPSAWIEVGTSDVPVEGNHVLVFSLWDKCVYTAYTQDGRWLHANGDGSDKYVIRNVTHWQDVPCAPDSRVKPK